MRVGVAELPSRDVCIRYQATKSSVTDCMRDARSARADGFEFAHHVAVHPFENAGGVLVSDNLSEDELRALLLLFMTATQHC